MDVWNISEVCIFSTPKPNFSHQLKMADTEVNEDLLDYEEEETTEVSVVDRVDM